jgi:hemolysin activation/secretion protein
VELPSFGGADVVRGFRADDAIGRRVWSLQNELWLPLRPASAQAPTNKLEAIVSQLKLAPFFDFGAAYQTLGSAPGFRTGPGLGLRLAMDKIIFRLDWAYGFGAAATSGSRGKFYFSVVSNLPF